MTSPNRTRADRNAHRVELAGQSVAGGIGSAFGAAKLRDAYKEEHPEKFRHAVRTAAVRASRAGVPHARIVSAAKTAHSGKPPFKALIALTGAGATAASAHHYRQIHDWSRRRQQQIAGLSKSEPRRAPSAPIRLRVTPQPRHTPKPYAGVHRTLSLGDNIKATALLHSKHLATAAETLVDVFKAWCPKCAELVPGEARAGYVQGIGRVQILGHHEGGIVHVLDRSDQGRLVHRDKLSIRRSKGTGMAKSAFGVPLAKADNDRSRHYGRMAANLGVLGGAAGTVGAGSFVVGQAEKRGHDPMGFAERPGRKTPVTPKGKLRILKPFSEAHAYQAKTLGGLAAGAGALSAAYKLKQRKERVGKSAFGVELAKALNTAENRRRASDVGLGAASAGVGGATLAFGMKNSHMLNQQANLAAHEARGAHHLIAGDKANGWKTPAANLDEAKRIRTVGARVLAVKKPAAALAAGASAAGGATLLELGRHTKKRPKGSAVAKSAFGVELSKTSVAGIASGGVRNMRRAGLGRHSTAALKDVTGARKFQPKDRAMFLETGGRRPGAPGRHRAVSKAHVLRDAVGLAGAAGAGALLANPSLGAAVGRGAATAMKPVKAWMHAPEDATAVAAKTAKVARPKPARVAKSAFLVSKAREDRPLVPPEGRPSKYVRRIEDVRAGARTAAREKQAAKSALKLVKKDYAPEELLKASAFGTTGDKRNTKYAGSTVGGALVGGGVAGAAAGAHAGRQLKAAGLSTKGPAAFEAGLKAGARVRPIGMAGGALVGAGAYAAHRHNRKAPGAGA